MINMYGPYITFNCGGSSWAPAGLLTVLGLALAQAGAGGAARLHDGAHVFHAAACLRWLAAVCQGAAGPHRPPPHRLFKHPGPGGTPASAASPACCRCCVTGRGAEPHLHPTPQVAPICDQVRERGDEAVKEFTSKFDRVDMDAVVFKIEVRSAGLWGWGGEGSSDPQPVRRAWGRAETRGVARGLSDTGRRRRCVGPARPGAAGGEHQGL